MTYKIVDLLHFTYKVIIIVIILFVSERAD